VELLLRVDDKGRVLIPRALRERLGIRKLVKARVGGRRVVLELVRDHVELLKGAVVEGTEDVEGESVS